MADGVDRPVILGPVHRYKLGPALGERVFLANDELGQRWAVEIGRAEAVQARLALHRKVAQGVLPSLRETGEMPGGRLGYLVRTWFPGYSLGNLMVEGRRLSTTEMRRMGYDLGMAVLRLHQCGLEITALDEDDLVYHTRERRWRLVDVKSWRPLHPDSRELAALAGMVRRAGGGGEQQPPWLAHDRPLFQLLQAASAGSVQLKPWIWRMRPVGGLLHRLRASLG